MLLPFSSDGRGMASLTQNVRDFVRELRDKPAQGTSHGIGRRLASALQWNSTVQTEQISSDLQIEVTRGFVTNQPAAIFVSNHNAPRDTLIHNAALLAYHTTIEWGLAVSQDEAIVFNSHWLRDNDWFQLPPIQWEAVEDRLDILEAITPSGLAEGLIDKIATTFYKPDTILLPIDDALVQRLDYWRDEALRHATNPSGVDEKIQALFAQLFILRAIEDRGLAAELDSLWSTLSATTELDLSKLTTLFATAREKIQTDLFDQLTIHDIPVFVIAGIIQDLYTPSQLPNKNLRYNFAWIQADVLGRAYQKYLSTFLMPKTPASPQMEFWHQPVRDVERISVQKLTGVYYTPSFLVHYITERCLDRIPLWEDNQPKLPRIADFACGSGSFLGAAVDSLLRRLREKDPNRPWVTELINQKCIVGIDNDYRAVTLARLALWLRFAEEPNPLPLPRLEEVIIHGDSLREETWSQLPQTYDVILGNPPFIATGKIQSRTELQRRFQTAQGRFDYSYLFVELAITKLRPGGLLGLVVPNRLFINRDAGTMVRTKIRRR